MRIFRQNQSVMFVLCLCFLGCWQGLSATALSADEIAIRLIDGKPCARCTISGAEKSISANLVIDLGLQIPLVLHSKTAKLLNVKPGDRLSVRFDGVGEDVFSDLQIRKGDVSMLSELTREHAAELGEIPAVVILGLPAFGDLIPQMDIAEGVIRLLDKVDSDALEAEAASRKKTAASKDTNSPEKGRSWIWNYSKKSTGYFLNGLDPDGMKMPVRFSTAQFDTTVDQEIAALSGAAGGEFEKFVVDGLDLMKYVALRPTDLAGLPKPRPDVITGTNLLSHFRVTIDHANLRIILKQTKSPLSAATERAYFVALAELDTDGIESFIKSNPGSRLVREASTRLLQARLDEYPPHDEALARAVETRARYEREMRRASTMVALADELLGGEREDRLKLARLALRIGANSASADLDANVSHRIQADLGRAAFLDGNLSQARRHLLAAAFGLPRDPKVSLWMGELYERMGKKARAWSRFMQAATDRNPPAEAFEGLDRLNHDPQFRATFTMAEAEQLLEGRAPEYHPSTRFADEAAAQNGAKRGGPVPLVELLPCSEHPPTQTAEMALAALGEYFDGQPPVLIQYHVAWPALDPLAAPVGKSRAEFYNAQLAPVTVFGGTNVIRGGQKSCGQAGNPAKIFETYKQACFESADAKSNAAGSGWKIEGRLERRKSIISGSVNVLAPKTGGDYRLHLILCESPLMVPGANQLVIRRNVARRALSPPEGLLVKLSAGKSKLEFPVDVDLVEVGKRITKEIATMEEEGEITFVMRPDYIDAGAVSIVAFLQDAKTKAVVSATRLEAQEPATSAGQKAKLSSERAPR